MSSASKTRYGAGVDDLWSAMTDLGRLASWYGQAEGDLRLSGSSACTWKTPTRTPPGARKRANLRGGSLVGCPSLHVLADDDDRQQHQLKERLRDPLDDAADAATDGGRQAEKGAHQVSSQRGSLH
jgi:hypothetical protein